VADHVAALDRERDPVHGAHGAVTAREEIAQRAEDSLASIGDAELLDEVADPDQRRRAQSAGPPVAVAARTTNSLGAPGAAENANVSSGGARKPLEVSFPSLMIRYWASASTGGLESETVAAAESPATSLSARPGAHRRSPA